MNWETIIFVIAGISLIIFMLKSWHNETPKKNMNPFEQIPSDLHNIVDLHNFKLVEEILVNEKDKNKSQKDEIKKWWTWHLI